MVEKIVDAVRQLAQCGDDVIEHAMAACAARGLNATLVAGFAGVEIMRRLIGVAQLPLTVDIERKRAWLNLSRRLVTEPDKGFA